MENKFIEKWIQQRAKLMRMRKLKTAVCTNFRRKIMKFCIWLYPSRGLLRKEKKCNQLTFSRSHVIRYPI